MTGSAEREASPQQQTSNAVAHIPFRQTSASAPQDLFGVLVATTLLLVLVAASLWFAKKKGWLVRWMAANVVAGQPGKPFRVENSVRLSRNTVLYRVEHGMDRYLIVESDRNINITRVESSMDESAHAEE